MQHTRSIRCPLAALVLIGAISAAASDQGTVAPDISETHGVAPPAAAPMTAAPPESATQSAAPARGHELTPTVPATLGGQATPDVGVRTAAPSSTGEDAPQPTKAVEANEVTRSATAPHIEIVEPRRTGRAERVWAGNGSCLADQMQPSNQTCMATLSQLDLAQSFRTEAVALGGAGIRMTDLGTGGDVTISLWDGLPTEGGTLLAAGSAFAIPDAWVDVSWPEVSVIPGGEYFLLFEGDDTSMCVAGDTDNPYPSGNVFANAGFSPFPEFDYTFRTCGTPASCLADETQSSNTTCMAFFSATDLAQSFRTDAVAIAGAGLLTSADIGGAGDVTIELWDALPNAGGTRLASGTNGAGPGTWVDVSWPAVPVVPGRQYFLVFLDSDTGMCVAGDTDNPYPFGNVFANAGYNEFEEFDYTFRTCGTPANGCLAEQNQPSNTTCMASFGQTDLAQSFRPGASTIGGAGIFLRDSTDPGGVVTIELWDALPNAGGTLLAAGAALGSPGGWTDVSWSTVPVVPGQEYFLVFKGTETGLCVAGDTNDPYPDGIVYANAGYGPFPDFDYTFRTCSTPNDGCVTDQNQPMTNTCMATFPLTDLAQSFRPTSEIISGAGILLTPTSAAGGSVTIELWDALPTAGGSLLSSGTAWGQPGEWVDVVWGKQVVVPGSQYFLVLTSSSSMCVAGDTTNPYPDGIVFANPGYQPFPEFDYTFRTCGTPGDGCVTDQSQASVNTCMAAFGQTDLAQSFRPDTNLIAGAGILLAANGTGGNVTIEMWDALPNAGGTLLTAGSAYGVPEQWVDVTWPKVEVTPGAQYFLVFLSSDSGMCVAGDTEDPYADGIVYANPGFMPFPAFDYTFRTCGTPADGCFADQLQLSNEICMAPAAIPDLAQSFRPTGTNVGGAGVLMRDGWGAGGDVTIELWDGLPNAGGNLLASATSPAVPGDWVDVTWPAVSVVPGDEYILVFESTDPGLCFAGDTTNPYPDGILYGKAGFLPFPDFDFTFRTCVSAGGTCPEDLNNNGIVDFGDILILLSNWGTPGVGDLDGSGLVDFGDLLLVLSNWGPCP